MMMSHLILMLRICYCYQGKGEKKWSYLYKQRERVIGEEIISKATDKRKWLEKDSGKGLGPSFKSASGTPETSGKGISSSRKTSTSTSKDKSLTR